MSVPAFALTSLLLHIANAMLVFALGAWKRIGWKVSAVAAGAFAVAQRHHEAVIWYAAQPELLVFFFCLLAFLCWVMWMQADRRRPLWYGGALACFVGALLSKESAVALVALIFLAGAVDRIPFRRLAMAVAPFAVLSGVYFALGYVARETHQHFNDGTFSLTAPVIEVLLRSSTRLVGVWGSIALAGLACWKAKSRVRLLSIAGAWMVIALLPYSFLTYMPRVPSRHTYLASVGLALIVAAGLVELWQRLSSHRLAIVTALCSAMVVHQCTYLWLTKKPQFERRAHPTEEVLRLADQGHSAIYMKCFPYDDALPARVLRILRPESEGRTQVVVGPAAASHPEAIDLCASADR